MLSACSKSNVKNVDDPGPAPAIQLKDDSSEAGLLFAKARAALEKGQFESAVLQYENLEATYPFGDHAAQARLDVGYAYYQQGELSSAQATLDRYLQLYPLQRKITVRNFCTQKTTPAGSSLAACIISRLLNTGTEISG